MNRGVLIADFASGRRTRAMQRLRQTVPDRWVSVRKRPVTEWFRSSHHGRLEKVRYQLRIVIVWCERDRSREREREIGRETDRQRQRQTDRDRQRQRQRQTDRQRQRQRQTETDRRGVGVGWGCRIKGDRRDWYLKVVPKRELKQADIRKFVSNAGCCWRAASASVRRIRTDVVTFLTERYAQAYQVLPLLRSRHFDVLMMMMTFSKPIVCMALEHRVSII